MDRAGDLRQRQARALGDPTRHAIFQVVAASDVPVSVAELTQQFGLNHNAVRQHLAKLREAGLVAETLCPHAGPGRPPLVYEPSISADVWLSVGPYEQLSLMLLDMMRTGRSAREVGAEAGAAVARRVNATDGSLAGITEVVEAEMARRGFDPVSNETDGGVELVLNYCPFAAAATDDPKVVCELHRGLAEGVVAAVAGSRVDVQLATRPPGQGGCRLRLSSAAPRPGAAAGSEVGADGGVP